VHGFVRETLRDGLRRGRPKASARHTFPVGVLAHQPDRLRLVPWPYLTGMNLASFPNKEVCTKTWTIQSGASVQRSDSGLRHRAWVVRVTRLQGCVQTD
jgi:hypothetical protein